MEATAEVGAEVAYSAVGAGVVEVAVEAAEVTVAIGAADVDVVKLRALSLLVHAAQANPPRPSNIRQITHLSEPPKLRK